MCSMIYLLPSPPQKNSLAMNIFIFISAIILLVLGTESKPKLDYQSRFDLAQEHYERVIVQMSCQTPQPRVFHMKDLEYKLVPPATVLYRCGSSTGCCDNPVHECVAKTKEKVSLYFFVVSRAGRSRRKMRRQSVKRFAFTNHTECHCVDKRRIPR